MTKKLQKKDISHENMQKNLTLKKFQQIIGIASQPVKEAEKRSAQKKNGDYSGKKTHQHTAVDTSETPRDTSR